MLAQQWYEYTSCSNISIHFIKTIKLGLRNENGWKLHPHQQDEDENWLSDVLEPENKFTFIGINWLLSRFYGFIEFLVQYLW